MSVCLSLLVCVVSGIIYFQKKMRHWIKQACMSWMASTSTQIASSSSSSTSMRTQIASSSSSSTPSRKYDVFLSFHGEDTRKTFTDHVHAALKRKGIEVFRDNEMLERGKTISEELLKAIQGSKYAIVVISPNYASSRWCLIELAKIIECMRDIGLRVLPIFYHVDPSDVRNQRKTFAEAFGRHEKDPKVDIQMMREWRAALTKVGSISGWHVDDSRHESIVVEEISGTILSGLRPKFFNDSKFPIGIESRVEEMMSLLSLEFVDVHFVGIYGMGGIGKTILAKAIYERVSLQFEASCFIADIREETKTHGLLSLQKHLINEILMDGEINILNAYDARGVIANRLRNKKVLIVLDDVDEVKQLEAISASHDWFGKGSRIIITSRDRHLLNKFVDSTYEVKKLNNAKALQLFSWRAFKKLHPEENYVELSKEIVKYADGLPLALVVFGSMLFGRSMDMWESAKDVLKENPNEEILDLLKISFDGLDESQKQLFLDIACFFNGANIDRIRHKLKSFGYHPEFNIGVLQEKSLITISPNKKIWMHDLLQKMGQKIVYCESSDPGKRSRLWCYKDVIHILKNDTGTHAIEAIVLKLPLQKQQRLNVEAFSKMKKLRMLEIGTAEFVPRFSKPLDNLSIRKWHRDNLHTMKWYGDPLHFKLSNELCFKEWWGYPLKSLPARFQSDNLVELIMRYSCIKQLWDGRKTFDKLKRIDLSDSQNLIETPDFSEVINLEELELARCTSLSNVHPSIGFLRWLKRLDLQGCKRLKRLPDEMNWESLVYLNISDCSSLEKLPEDMSGMECLEYLYADGSAIRKLPSSIAYLKKLRVLVAGGKRGLDPINLLIHNSFSSLSSLREVDLSYRNLSDGAIPSNLNCLSSLEILNLSGNKFTRIPDSVCQLYNLQTLGLAYCSRLELSSNLENSLFSNSFSGLRSLQKLDLSYCNLLDRALSNDLTCLSSLRSLNLDGNKFTRIPYAAFQLSNLQTLSLAYCSTLELSSNPDNALFPNSFLGLISLQKLDLSYCNLLLDGAISNDLSCLCSLRSLKLNGNKFTRIPDCAFQLSNLQTLSLAYCSTLELSSNPGIFWLPNSFSGLSSLFGLNLSYCNLLDEAIPNDLSFLSSLRCLNLSGNKFTRIPDSVDQLSNLYELFLDDCSSLQVLPKLPLGLDILHVKNCSSLEMFYNKMEMWTSNEKLRSIDCSFVAAYIDYDGKPCKILHLHPRSPLWIDSESEHFNGSMVACGPALLGSGIPDWFNTKSTNSSGKIQIDTDLDLEYDLNEWKGYALFIVYQFHESETYPSKRRQQKVHEHGNSNSNFPYFVCQFQANKVDDIEPLLLCAPVPSVGPNGFWVYIPTEWFWRRARNSLGGLNNLKASITAGSLDVEVEECGARVVCQHDASELYQVLNSISPSGLDLRTYQKLSHMKWFRVFGPIKGNLML